MRARRSVLYVIQRFSIVTSPLERPPQSIRPPATSDARSWKLRTARDKESLRRSKRAKGDGGGGASGAAAGAAGAGCAFTLSAGRGAGTRGGGAGARNPTTSLSSPARKHPPGQRATRIPVIT